MDRPIVQPWNLRWMDPETRHLNAALDMQSNCQLGTDAHEMLGFAIQHIADELESLERAPLPESQAPD